MVKVIYFNKKTELTFGFHNFNDYSVGGTKIPSQSNDTSIKSSVIAS